MPSFCSQLSSYFWWSVCKLKPAAVEDTKKITVINIHVPAFKRIPRLPPSLDQSKLRKPSTLDSRQQIDTDSQDYQEHTVANRMRGIKWHRELEKVKSMQLLIFTKTTTQIVPPDGSCPYAQK